jgi:predicted ribosomally synthesized peptide with SipW-like signal peptide
VIKMKKILKSVFVSLTAIALVTGVSIAFFSDTETSSGNTFTAGAIELKVDNSSWYNGEPREDLSWEYDDLTGHLFFNYRDLKPGDWGEDTVSLHVFSNDAWACADLYLTKNDDMSSTEPELEDGDDPEDPADIWDGELAQNIMFYFWVDDGDNVYENGEQMLTRGPASEAIRGLSYALADAKTNLLGESPLIGSHDYYIGKYWCYGVGEPTGLGQDGVGNKRNPGQGSGFTCDGSEVDNQSQTDNMMAEVSFYAEQSRNNEGFLCSDRQPTPPGDMGVLDLENKDPNWRVIEGDETYGTLVYSASPTFYGTLVAQGLEANAKYQITLNGPGSCTTTDNNLAGFGANLFQSGYWNNWAPGLAPSCIGSPGEGIYNMNLINDHYTVMSDALGEFNYAFNFAFPSGTYSNVKVLVKKMLDEHVSPWVDSSTTHTTNLYETAPITFTID